MPTGNCRGETDVTPDESSEITGTGDVSELQVRTDRGCGDRQRRQTANDLLSPTGL